MAYRLIVSELAQWDIADATDYYEVKQQGLGKIFLISLKDTFRLIALNPFMYMRVYKVIRRALLKKFPYGVFYKIDSEKQEIIVYRVLSTFRDPKNWQVE